MKGVKLTDMVPVEELLQMRGNGMTNNDIATALGVSYNAVLAAIGPQGGRKSRHAYFADKPEKKADKASEYKPRLVVQNKSFTLHGMLGEYTIDCKKGEVIACIDKAGGDSEMLAMLLKARANTDEFKVDGQEGGPKTIDEYIKSAQTFIDELEAIKNRMHELAMHNEMW